MAREFGLGAGLFGAGVVVGAVGLPAVPVKPHLTTYTAEVGTSATMAGDGPVESLDPFMAAEVLGIALLVAFVIAMMIIALRPTHPVPGRGKTTNPGRVARPSGLRRLLRS